MYSSMASSSFTSALSSRTLSSSLLRPWRGSLEHTLTKTASRHRQVRLVDASYLRCRTRPKAREKCQLGPCTNHSRGRNLHHHSIPYTTLLHSRRASRHVLEGRRRPPLPSLRRDQSYDWFYFSIPRSHGKKQERTAWACCMY